MNSDIGIYIHIPFCKSKCYYCDFVSYINCNNIFEYINCVCKEILKNAEILSQSNIKSIYIGGGTPSYIDPKFIKQILDTIFCFVQDDSNNIIEITLEVNPGTLTENNVKDYKKMGVNRISMGVQSVFDDVLKAIGRTHTYSDVLTSLELLKNNHFNNISIDLINPLPNFTYDRFNDAKKLLTDMFFKYDIKHVSLYDLEIHENTKLDFLLNQKFIDLPTEEDAEKIYNSLLLLLKENGYNRYEIANFSKKNYESIHNCIYWDQECYLGFGVNAASFFGGRRYTNTSDIQEYIECISNDKPYIKENIFLDKLDLMKDYIILKTRKIEGINVEEFKRKFKTDIFSVFKIEIDKLISEKLLVFNQNSIYLSEKGHRFANRVWKEFI